MFFPGWFLIQSQLDYWSDWLIDWLIDRLLAYSFDWLIDWLIDWSIDWLLAYSFDWLIDWWSIDWWLSGWLIDWLVVKFVSSLIVSRLLGSVKRMNQTFASMDSLLWAGKQVTKLMPELSSLLDLAANQSVGPQENANSSGLLDLFQLATQVLESQGLGDLIPGLNPSWFAGFQANASSVGGIRDQLTLMGTLIGNLTQFMSCFDLDKFVPMVNETALNKRGQVIYSEFKLFSIKNTQIREAIINHHNLSIRNWNYFHLKKFKKIKKN